MEGMGGVGGGTFQGSPTLVLETTELSDNVEKPAFFFYTKAGNKFFPTQFICAASKMCAVKTELYSPGSCSVRTTHPCMLKMLYDGLLMVNVRPKNHFIYYLFRRASCCDKDK